MDSDFQALLDRMHRQRRNEALFAGIMIFMGGVGIGLVIGMLIWML